MLRTMTCFLLLTFQQKIYRSFNNMHDGNSSIWAKMTTLIIVFNMHCILPSTVLHILYLSCSI